jgi:hypothetical protein
MKTKEKKKRFPQSILVATTPDKKKKTKQNTKEREKIEKSDHRRQKHTST